jgi:C4-type Zn-finger protein
MNLKDIEGSLNNIRKEVTVTFTKQAEVSQLKRRSNDLKSGKSQIEERTTIVINIDD